MWYIQIRSTILIMLYRHLVSVQFNNIMLQVGYFYFACVYYLAVYIIYGTNHVFVHDDDDDDDDDCVIIVSDVVVTFIVSIVIIVIIIIITMIIIIITIIIILTKVQVRRQSVISFNVLKQSVNHA